MKKLLTIVLALSAMMAFACVPAFAKGEQVDCEHQWSEWTVIDESTCEYQGYEQRECGLCGETEKRNLPLADHKWSEWGVDYDATCTESGEMERYCSECGERKTQTIPAKGHAWGSWKITKAATPYVTGKKYRECNRCGVEENATVPKRTATANEKASIKTVKGFFAAAKIHNTPKMKSFFAKCPQNAFAHKTSDLAKWSRKHNKKKMSWKVIDIRTSGKTITVKMKVTYANGYAAIYKAYDDCFTWYLSHQKASKKKVTKKMESCIKKAMKKTPKKSTKTISLTCKHTAKGWKILKPTSEIKNIVEMNFDKAGDDYLGN